jgi:FRG domain
VAADTDAVARLGLIQHYGGPTRLLDVTRSPYAALFFAFEAPGEHDRALWAISSMWCMAECARAMHDGEGITFDEAWDRLGGAQTQLVYSLIYAPTSSWNWWARSRIRGRCSTGRVGE